MFNSKKKTTGEIKDVKKYIIENIVQPEYINSIRSAYKWQKIWSSIYGMSLGSAKLILLVVTILSFVASFYDDRYISFSAGICGVAGTGLIQYSSFARAKSRDGVADINKLLYDLGIKGIPDLHDNDDTFLNSANSKNPDIENNIKILNDTISNNVIS